MNRLSGVKNFSVTFSITFLTCFFIIGCDAISQPAHSDNGSSPTENAELTFYSSDDFVMGADLSYVNQILDHGGTYHDSGSVENPYKIFKDHGTNVVRLRLWHDPDWVQHQVYTNQQVPLYSGLEDVARSIEQSQKQGMAVNLDFHFSDIWADPSEQRVPEAWTGIRSLEVLQDSVYNYTRQTLTYLDSRGLLPEMVQIGNETNCGMIYSDSPDGFPKLNICEGDNWQNLGRVLNSGIQAVRDVANESNQPIKVILHVAQPENVAHWFDQIVTTGAVSDFDILGFSYYSKWSDVPLDEISNYVDTFRSDYGKQVMIMETAYPFSLNNDDSYNNILGQQSLVEDYPASPTGQYNYMKRLTEEVIAGGGSGVFYWEPAWISSNMKDLWGTGSAWENNAFFDYDGNLHKGIKYMTDQYSLN